MRDDEIVGLYHRREEAAVAETQRKYHKYLTTIAYNILRDTEDARESVNDTYLAAWNSIPPNSPKVLSVYLAKITRRISIDRYRKSHRSKRGGGEYALSLAELNDCIPAGNATVEEADFRSLAEHINGYLRTLPPRQRTVFIGRYFYCDSLTDVAAHHGMTVPRVKSMLYRTRQGLKAYLTEEGYFHDK